MGSKETSKVHKTGNKKIFKKCTRAVAHLQPKVMFSFPNNYFNNL